MQSQDLVMIVIFLGCSTPALAASVSTLGGLVFGYELGIISGALLQLQTQFQLDCVQQETIVSALLLGAFCASLVGGWLIDRRGRRNSILLSCVMVIAGTALLSTGGFFAILVIGRAITGFAICISSMSCCIFVSEMVSPKRRGLMVTLYEMGITVGILIAYAFNYILTDITEGWRYMFGFAMVPTMLQLVSIWFLRSKGTPTDSLSRESRRGLVEEADAEVPGEDRQMERQQYSTWYLFQSKDNMRTRTCIGLGLVLFQQFTGQPNVLLYASTIFHTLGFQSTDSAVLASLGLGIVKVITTLAAIVCADRMGRRPLLIGGSVMMAVGLLTIGFMSGSSVLDARRPCGSPSNSTLPTQYPSNLRINTYANASMIRSLPASGSPKLSLDPGSLAGLNTIPVFTEAPGETDHEAVNWVILISMMAVVCAFSIGFGPSKSTGYAIYKLYIILFTVQCCKIMLFGYHASFHAVSELYCMSVPGPGCVSPIIKNLLCLVTWLVLSEIFPAGVRGRAFAFITCFNWAANLLVTFSFLNVIGTFAYMHFQLKYNALED